MKILFDFNPTENKHMNIPCNVPFNAQDRLDGLTDTVSFEFMYDEDLMIDYHKHQKSVLKVYKNVEDTEPFKEYRMVISDLNRDTNTMYMDNNAPLYTYTCTIVEPTVLIDENIRTNIAITPYTYPKDENGKYPYSTLYDAYLKIMSCHNLIPRNEKVYNFGSVLNFENSTKKEFDIDIFTTSDDSELNITFKGNTKVTSGTRVDISGNRYRYTNTKTIGGFSLNLKNELPYSRTIISYEEIDDEFLGKTKTQKTSVLTLSIDKENKKFVISFDTQPYVDFQSWSGILKYGKEDSFKIYNVLSKVACPSLTYIDLSTFDQLSDIFDRVGAVPYLDFDEQGKSYVTFYLKQGSYEGDEIKTLSNLSTEEVSRPSDMYSNSVSSQVKNLVCDDDLIIYPNFFSKYILDDYNKSSEEERFKNKISCNTGVELPLLQRPVSIVGDGAYYGIDICVPNSFDAQRTGIVDAESFFVQLPTNIEYIKAVYLVSTVGNNQKFSGEYELKPLNMNNLVEYSEFGAFSKYNQKFFSYFVRGDNKIKQIVSLLADISTIDRDWKWDDAQLYGLLRTVRLVVVYKPMLDTNFTYYDFENIDSKTTKYIDLPYKLVSDKQVSNVLSYEFEKYNSDKILFNQVSMDADELNHYAGERVFYKGKRFLQKFYLGEFNSYSELINTHNTSSDINKNLWCKINEDIYTINPSTSQWEKYIGEECVITKVSYTVYNNTISASYELSNKIAFNNVISSYSDNVRISDNLSTENVVNRNIQLYKTVLLNAFNSPNETPSLTSRSAFPFNKGYDSFLFANAMNKNGWLKFWNDTSKDRSNESLIKLSRLPMNVKTEELSFFIITDADWNPSSFTTEYSDYISSNNDFVLLLDARYGGYQADYTISFSYDDSDNSLTARRALMIDNKILLPNRTEIPLDLEDNLYEYRYYFDSSDGEEFDILTFEYRKNATSMWTVLKRWNMSDFNFPKYVYTGNVIQNNIQGQAHATNYNTIWQNSNTLLTASLHNQDSSVIGYTASGFSGNLPLIGPNEIQWNFTEPIFYNKSSYINKLETIGSKDIGFYNIVDLISDTGFTDVNIDIREKISLNIQYLFTYSNTVEFIKKYYNNKFGDYGIDLPESSDSYFQIKEINTNIQWMSNVTNVNTNYENKLKLVKVPKGSRIVDALDNKIDTSNSYIGNGLIYVSNTDGIYYPKITIFFTSLIDGNDCDLLLIGESNGVENPLMIMSYNGEPTQTIRLSTFII